MPSIAVNTVRKALPKLSATLQAADAAGYTNGRVNKREAADMAAKTGEQAIVDLQKYAQKRYGTSSPSIEQLNKAMAEAMRNIANGDAGGMLTVKEQEKLAFTWRSVIEFARSTKNKSVEQILGE